MTAVNKDELREKLAAIEHERWSDWQNWVHKVFLEGNFKEFMLRWQTQIDTPYSKLSEAEKNSDREQVDRYWHLIDQYITAQLTSLIERVEKDLKLGEGYGEVRVSHVCHKDDVECAKFAQRMQTYCWQSQALSTIKQELIEGSK